MPADNYLNKTRPILLTVHIFINSLFSMETASIFYSEEDDLRSWFYSKHLVELERQEHIKRLREQGIVIPEEELVEEKGMSTFGCWVFFRMSTSLVLYYLFNIVS